MSRFNRAGWALTALASLLAIGALTLGPRESGSFPDAGPGAPLQEGEASSAILTPLPALSHVAATAQRIGIRRHPDEAQDWLSLTRDPKGDWQLASLGNWPARQDKVTGLLHQLNEARLRTRKPATDQALQALGLAGQSPVVNVTGSDGEVSLQLGGTPSAARSGADALPGRYVRWLSLPDSPVLELSRDIGLPDWRGGLAASEVLDLSALLHERQGPPALSRVEVRLAPHPQASHTPHTRGLAPDSAAAEALMAALSPLNQNDLRLRVAQADWQPAVTLTLNWSHAARQYRQPPSRDDHLQLTLSIASGSKPWARLTLEGTRWPAALVRRLAAVEIQVNGALRERLIGLGKVIETHTGPHPGVSAGSAEAGGSLEAGRLSPTAIQAALQAASQASEEVASTADARSAAQGETLGE